MEKNVLVLPKMRTINEAHRWLKENDPETALSKNALRNMVVKGRIPSLKIGNRYLLDIGVIIPILQRELKVGSLK